MAKKKKTATTAAATPSSGAATNSPKSVKAGPPTIAGMALIGAILGCLSGLNQWPQPPAALSGDIASAAWMGYLLGVQTFDSAAAIAGAVLGLLVGAGFALSFLFGERRMLACWLLGGAGLAVGAVAFKSTSLAAVLWVVGWSLALTVPDREPSGTTP